MILRLHPCSTCSCEQPSPCNDMPYTCCVCLGAVSSLVRQLSWHTQLCEQPENLYTRLQGLQVAMSSSYRHGAVAYLVCSWQRPSQQRSQVQRDQVCTASGIVASAQDEPAALQGRCCMPCTHRHTLPGCVMGVHACLASSLGTLSAGTTRYLSHVVTNISFQ